MEEFVPLSLLRLAGWATKLRVSSELLVLRLVEPRARAQLQLKVQVSLQSSKEKLFLFSFVDLLSFVAMRDIQRIASKKKIDQAGDKRNLYR